MTRIEQSSLKEAALGTVSGRRLLLTIAAGAVASAVVGTATYYAIHFLAPSANTVLTMQIIVAEVYSTLIAAFVTSFAPLRQAPLQMRFTSAGDLGIAALAWVAVVVSSLVIYLLISPNIKALTDTVQSLLSVATDVKRLEGQTSPVIWAVAIARGCFLVPVFEELLFRGLLLGWLRKRLSAPLAVTVSALLFAAMHGYPIVMPYTFIFGLLTGWVRLRTGSTLNTFFMHVTNNLVFLYLGFSLLR